MKKFLKISFLVVLVVGMFTGCGGASTTHPGTPNLVKDQVIYVKSTASIAKGSNIDEEVNAKCTIPKNLVAHVLKYSKKIGVKIVVKDDIRADEYELKLFLVEVVSQGNIIVGRNEHVVISASIVKGNDVIYSMGAARVTGGGAFGNFKSFCSVLDVATNKLGEDTANWVANPYKDVKLGDTKLIK